MLPFVGPAGDWLPPDFTEIQKASRPLPNGPVIRLLLPATPVIHGFRRFKTNSAGWPSLPAVARCYPPRSKVIPHRGVYWRCQEFCTFEALMRAPELGLGSFSLDDSLRKPAERFARTGIPRAASAPCAPPRKGSIPLCTEVRRTRFNSQGTWRPTSLAALDVTIVCPAESGSYRDFCTFTSIF